MKKPILSIEDEFHLMADYQNAIECKSVIVENALNDKHRYSLVEISEPFPTYEEYINGNDFDEGEIIISSSSMEDLKEHQKRCTMYKLKAS